MSKVSLDLDSRQIKRLVRDLPFRDKIDIITEVERMRAILELDSKQVKKLVHSLPLKDKIEIVEELRNETWRERWKRLLNRVDKSMRGKRRLSDDEVVRICKEVRAERYAQSHH